MEELTSWHVGVSAEAFAVRHSLPDTHFMFPFNMEQISLGMI